MGNIDDFHAQWQELTTIIESELIRDLRSKKQVDTLKLDRIFEEEKEKWSSSINYRGVWLKSLKVKSPQVATLLIDTLAKQNLSHSSLSLPKRINYVIISVSIFLVFALGAFLIDIALWKSIIGSIVIGFFLSSIVFKQYENKVILMRKRISNVYVNELTKMLNEINKIFL